MPNCGAPECENRSSERPELSFHRLPSKSKKELREKWVNSIKRKVIPNEMYVCSDHFKPECFKRDFPFCIHRRDTAHNPKTTTFTGESSTSKAQV